MCMREKVNFFYSRVRLITTGRNCMCLGILYIWMVVEELVLLLSMRAVWKLRAASCGRYSKAILSLAFSSSSPAAADGWIEKTTDRRKVKRERKKSLETIRSRYTS